MSNIPNKHANWTLPTKTLPKQVFCIQCKYYWPAETWCKKRDSTITRDFARVGRICREWKSMKNYKKYLDTFIKE